MARKVIESEYTARRNEILDSAQRLVYTKGFDQMTIQDILDQLQISKGAFYHYFNSKTDVLEALVERMVVEQVTPLLDAIVQDQSLTALEKLHAYFDVSARWKSAQKEMVLSLTRVWYSDENALFRQRLNALSIQKITPMLGGIIQQGVREGVFNAAHPQHFGEVIVYVMLGLSDKIVGLLLRSDEIDQDDPIVLESIIEYEMVLADAMERLLGAPAGSIHPFDPETLREWFPPANNTAAMAAVNGKESLQ